MKHFIAQIVFRMQRLAVFSLVVATLLTVAGFTTYAAIKSSSTTDAEKAILASREKYNKNVDAKIARYRNFVTDISDHISKDDMVILNREINGVIFNLEREKSLVFANKPLSIKLSSTTNKLRQIQSEKEAFLSRKIVLLGAYYGIYPNKAGTILGSNNKMLASVASSVFTKYTKNVSEIDSSLVHDIISAKDQKDFENVRKVVVSELSANLKKNEIVNKFVIPKEIKKIERTVVVATTTINDVQETISTTTPPSDVTVIDRDTSTATSSTTVDVHEDEPVVIDTAPTSTAPSTDIIESTTTII